MKPGAAWGTRPASALAMVALWALWALLALLGLTVLTACVMVPVTREVYDPECHSMRRQIVLEPTAVGYFQACGGRDCSALLVAMGAVTAASVVVSGSIAVVGNVAYWAEHKASCKRNDGAQAPVPPTVPASSTSRAPAPP